MSVNEIDNHGKGDRAEEVASWYFRLNGFLSIPGYVVHPDEPSPTPRTESDLMAVRFPHSAERIGTVRMPDDPLIEMVANGDQVLFILVEVKAGRCNINGPWSERHKGNMQRAIHRLGFAATDDEANGIAEEMYESLQWKNQEYALQYISVGRQVHFRLKSRYPKLVQITWEDVGRFLYGRFVEFPAKLNVGRPIHRTWPSFGRLYGEYVSSHDRRPPRERAVDTLCAYSRRAALYNAVRGAPRYRSRNSWPT